MRLSGPGPLFILLVGVLMSPPSVVAQAGPVVDVEWLARRMGDDRVLLLHADMSSATYEEGHIPEARFLDLRRMLWDGDPAWGAEIRSSAEIGGLLRQVGMHDTVEHVVVYSTNPLFASRAFLTLEVMGLAGRAHVLDGGQTAWLASGRELTTVEPLVPGAGVLTLSPRDDILVSADWVRDRLDAPEIALVDARPDDEYTGEDGGMGGIAKPGHIPGAYQMYWEELVESRSAPFFHAEDELRELFADAGVSEGDTVVAYCMVGWRASYTYLAARMLGFDARFYDGSWRDWGTRDDLPAVTGPEPRQIP